MNIEERKALLRTLGEQAGSAGATARLRGLVMEEPLAQAAVDAAKSNERNLKELVDLAEARVIVKGTEGKNEEERKAALLIAKHEDEGYQLAKSTLLHARGSTIDHEQKLNRLTREWRARRVSVDLFIALAHFFGAGE